MVFSTIEESNFGGVGIVALWCWFSLMIYYQGLCLFMCWYSGFVDGSWIRRDEDASSSTDEGSDEDFAFLCHRKPQTLLWMVSDSYSP